MRRTIVMAYAVPGIGDAERVATTFKIQRRDAAVYGQPLTD